MDRIAARLKACLVGARYYSPSQRLEDLDTLVTFARDVKREGERFLKKLDAAARGTGDGETQTDQKDGGEGQED